MDWQCHPSMTVCLCVCLYAHLCLHGLCFHLRVSSAFTVNPKKNVKYVYLCPQIFMAGKKESNTLIFRSSRRVLWIKYLGRRSLDLLVLSESPGSHWFLTRQLGHHYNKMHYSQPHLPSDTLANLILPYYQLLLATVHVCVCVLVSTVMDTIEGLPFMFCSRQDFTSQELWPVEHVSAGKIQLSSLSYRRMHTHTHHYVWAPITYWAYGRSETGSGEELGGNTSVFFHLRQRQWQIKSQSLKWIKFILCLIPCI